jgi:hypothetical protein
MPKTFSGPRCTNKACKEILNEQLCKYCLEWQPEECFTRRLTKGHGIFRAYCRACERIRRRKHEKDRPDLKQAAVERANAKRREIANQLLEDMIETNSLAFKVLSETQWHATCEHFDGCAVCGKENIEARAFFVPFEQGGKYAVWNIFPVCGTCGIIIRISTNPFRWVKGVQAKKMGLTPERATKLIDYLTSQIEKVED